VYGNKGSTDQHAYVQQLRDGLNNFFAVFIEVLKDISPRTQPTKLLSDLRPGEREVEPGCRSGDYLTGFYLGTREALYEKDRESMTVTIPEVSEFYVGMLIALFERTVGLYASLINVNAYHQPGVEAGKKAAASVLRLQGLVEEVLAASHEPLTVEAIAEAIGEPKAVEMVFKIVRHLGANGRAVIQPGPSIFEDRYGRHQRG
jgi:glucose-6-phosphate isomerase